MSKQKYNILKAIGYSSVGLFVLVVIALLFPVVQQNTQALAYSTDQSLIPQLGLAVASQQEWEVDPSLANGAAITTTNLMISSSGSAGYKVYLSGKDGQTSLRSMDGSVKAEIRSIANESALSGFLENTWGYSLSSNLPTNETIYQSIPLTNDAATLEVAAGEDTTNRYYLSFATKINTSLPAGAYTGGIVISVVATPWKIRSLSDITYMQDMTSYVCDYSTENETKQLIDSRDGKSYWVAKLKDGNCWMTQNLALDLDTNEVGNAVAVSDGGNKVELNNNNTDIIDVWHEYVPSKTETTIPGAGEISYTSARSWNLGKIVLTNPTKSTKCDNILAGETLTQCEWYEDVSDMEMGYSATETSSISLGGKSYDAHYLIGNYYQWNTATAGSGVNLTSSSEANTDPSKLVDAPSSICPKGWKMPSSGRYYANNTSYPYEREDSFMDLLIAYGYPEGKQGVGWISYNGYPNTPTVGRVNPDYSPMYFARSGGVNLSNLAVTSAGYYGAYWAKTTLPSSITNSYLIGFIPGNISPSDNNDRSIGFPIRCLAH